MVHFASIRHPASILDDLHGKVLNEAYQISKSTVPESVSSLGLTSINMKKKFMLRANEIFFFYPEQLYFAEHWKA